jgi:hypothetical protein
MTRICAGRRPRTNQPMQDVLETVRLTCYPRRRDILGRVLDDQCGVENGGRSSRTPLWSDSRDGADTARSGLVADVAVAG